MLGRATLGTKWLTLGGNKLREISWGPERHPEIGHISAEKAHRITAETSKSKVSGIPRSTESPFSTERILMNALRAERGKVFVNEVPAWERLNRAELLLARIASAPAEWQTRPVCGPLSWAELQDLLRSQRASSDAKLNLFAVPASEKSSDSFGEIIGHLLEEATISLAKDCLFTYLGVPWLSILDLPTNFTSAIIYVDALNSVRTV